MNVDEGHAEVSAVTEIENARSPMGVRSETPSVKSGKPSETKWTVTAVVCWFAVAFIRGTTPAMLSLAGDSIAPTVVIMLRAPGALLLYAVLVSTWSYRDKQYRSSLFSVAKIPSTYFKVLFLGVFQSSTPFLLFTYGLRYLPPDFGGVFMALAPVFALFNEHTIFRLIVKTRPTRINRYHGVGILLILGGVVTFLLPVLLDVANPDLKTRIQCNLTDLDSANVTYAPLTGKHRRRSCATTSQVIPSLFLLMAASFLFGVVAVFWRNFNGQIHFSVAGFGQIFFGFLFSLAIWGALEEGKFRVDWNAGSIGAVVYLSTFSAFLTPCLLFHLIYSVGAVPAARSLTLVPVISWLESIIFFSRGKDKIGQEIGGLACFLVGLVLFEGRVDVICGLRMPWATYLERRKNTREAEEMTNSGKMAPSCAKPGTFAGGDSHSQLSVREHALDRMAFSGATADEV